MFESYNKTSSAGLQNINFGNISSNNSNTISFSSIDIPTDNSQLLSMTREIPNETELFNFGNASIESTDFDAVTQLFATQLENIDYSDVLDDGFKVQGVTKIGGKLVISAYDHKKERNSRLYFYDPSTGMEYGHIILDSDPHAGGITYAEDLGILFISGKSGKTTTLDLSGWNYEYLLQIMKNNGGKFDLSSEDTQRFDTGIIIKNNINVSKITDVGKNSTMFYDGNGNLYVATFNEKSEQVGEIVRYKISKDNIKHGTAKVPGKIKAEQVGSAIIPDMTQGVAITEYNNEKYIITSQSYSQKDSIITFQKINDDGSLSYVGAKVLYNRPGAESLTVDKNNNLMCVFETGDAEVYVSNIGNMLGNLSDESIVRRIRESQIEFAQAGNSFDDTLHDVQQIASNYFEATHDPNFIDEFIDVASEDGFSGMLSGMAESFSDTYGQLASDTSATVGHLASSVLASDDAQTSVIEQFFSNLF